MDQQQTQHVLSLTTAVRLLNEQVPLNDYGLPEGFYRPELIILPVNEPATTTTNEPTTNEPTAATATTDRSLQEGTKSRAENTELADTPLSTRLKIGQLPTNSNICRQSEHIDSAAVSLSSLVHANAHAYQELDYSEGFPALPSGEPFWAPWSSEPLEAFEAFQMYLKHGVESLAEASTAGLHDQHNQHNKDSGEIDPKSLELTDGDDPLASNKLVGGARMLYALQPYVGIPLDELRNCYYLYNWAARAKAYDLFNEAIAYKVKLRRAISLEDHHYIEAEKLVRKCLAYFDSEEFELLLTPKVAVDLFKVATQLQRLSAGLNPTGVTRGRLGGASTTPMRGIPGEGASGSPYHVGPLSASSDMDAILRQVGGGGAVTQQQIQKQRALSEEAEHKLQELLEDPESAEMAQELIIRMAQMGR